MCKLIFRFENTVTAILNGHTHNDHFHVYYSTDEPTRPISVAVNGGSVTPFSDLNSNYKIYTVDSATFVSMLDANRMPIINAVLFIENFVRCIQWHVITQNWQQTWKLARAFRHKSHCKWVAYLINMPIYSYINNEFEKNSLFFVRFEVLTAMDMKSSIFSHMLPYSPLKVIRRFRETCFLHLPSPPASH
jgi:hypothetical protein